MGLNEDVDKMTEWLTEEQITNILLQRMDADEAQWKSSHELYKQSDLL